MMNFVRPSIKSSLLVAAVSAFFQANANADFTLISPNSQNSTATACADYATEVLHNPWDFTDSTDIPMAIKPLQYANVIEPLSFSSGLLRLTPSSSNPYFSLTTPQVPGSIPLPEGMKYGVNSPIDPSKYKLLTFRMYTDQDSFYQVYWTGGGTFAITDPVTTYKNRWITYSLDLSSATINDNSGGSYQWGAATKEQLRFDPTNVAGSDVRIDWMQLTKAEADCPQAGVTFQSDANVPVSLIVDDNTNFSDGIQQIKVVSATGSQQTQNFSTGKLFPGTYNVYGFKSDDYATLYGDPWDMNNSDDIDSTRIYNISGAGYSDSKFCGTTSNSDGNFYMALPLHQPINADLFKVLTVKVETSDPSKIAVANVQFFDRNQTLKGSMNDLTFDSVNKLVQFDLTNVAGWSGDIYYVRIQPTILSGVQFCIPWIKLTVSTPSDLNEPAIPTLVQAPSTLSINSSSQVSFVQPDNRGGRDCPTHDLGNPWTMNSQNDIQTLANIKDMEFRPYNQVTDSRGTTRTGDFLRGRSVLGNGDPKVQLLAFSGSVDADRCTHLCYSLILNRSLELYHSVARVTYFDSKGSPQNGDDVINSDTWTNSDVCLYMKELQQEPALPAGSQHPWHGNINFLSLDPHEDEDDTEFFVDYVELREDHKANSQFAVVVDAPITKRVDIYASTSKPTSSAALPSGASLIGTLGTSRSSNVLLWNTAGVGDNTYYIAAVVDASGSNPITANAPLPVVVNHSESQDTTAPVVILDSPSDGRKVTSSLQVAGAVFDDVRHAVTELFIDDVYNQAIVPNIYHKGAREQYPNLSPDKPGFNIFVDVSNLSNGSHTYKLVSYDTAGNTTVSTGSFIKGATADADITYPNPDAAAVPYAPPSPSLAVNIADNKDVIFAANGYEGCTSTAVVAGKYSDLSDAVTLFNGVGSVAKSALDIPQWIASSSSGRSLDSAVIERAKKATPTPQPKKKCKKKKVCKKKNGKKVCKIQNVCTQPTPATPTATPTPPPTATPATEDGVLYFQARCNGSQPSNTVFINFGTQVSNTTQTTFETFILQQLQAKVQ